MKSKLQSAAVSLSIVGLFLSACGQSSPTTAPDAVAGVDATLTQPPSVAANGTDAPAVAATVTDAPVLEPTATVYPPVYNPETLGNIHELSSFTMTTTSKRIEDGDLVVDQKEAIEYIQEPFSIHQTHGGWTATYVIGDRSYERINGGKGWKFSVGPGQGKDILPNAWESVLGLISDVETAQFAGQEDFAGIPANHFRFDLTNFRVPYVAAGVAYNEWKDVEGELYLAQDGNYLLYFHSKASGTFHAEDGTTSEQTQEKTLELSSVNQLAGIAVPTDFDLELELGLPLPEGSTLSEILYYNDGFLPYYYTYVTPVISFEEFLEFYTSMAPTNGWTFSHSGEVANNVNCDAAYTDLDCVILEKGNRQAILYYREGWIGADYEK
ncbi:MAG TPA: hypothetical protein VLD63_12680 [Anaerolineales bacterium]|nr:hypothetical protein [Anaerolineales bacterium]